MHRKDFHLTCTMLLHYHSVGCKSKWPYFVRLRNLG